MASSSFRRLKSTFLLVAVVGAVLLLFAIGEAVKLIIVSALLAYILDPAVTWLESRGLSRTTSTLVFFGTLVVAIGIILVGMFPLLAEQLRTFQAGASSEKTAAVFARIDTIIHDKLGFMGFEDFRIEDKIQGLRQQIGEKSIDFLMNDVVSVVVHAVSIPFIIFFFLKDGRDMKKQFISIIPNRYFEFSLDLLYKMDVQLGNYLRSQFLDAVVFGLLSTLALWVLGVKYFLFIGAFAGLANLIPYVGPVAGALPAILVSVLDTGDVIKATQIVIAFVVLKLADDVLVQPLLVARNVDLHPLLVLLAIIIGGQLFGILGMLLAVPFTGFVKVVLQESIVTFRKYRFT
jgi:putative permease